MKMSRTKIIIDKLFNKYLIVTNVTVGGGFMILGDAIQQSLERKIFYEKPYDPKRTEKMAVGGLCFGILGHGWYKFLDKKFPGTARNIIIKKLLCEMALGPPLILALFLAVGFAEKRTVRKSFEEFSDNFVSICAMDWGFYVPLQYLNFYYLAPQYRFAYVSVITVVYDVFLSYILNKSKLKIPTEDVAIEEKRKEV